MKRLGLLLLSLLYPTILFAQDTSGGALSFDPPPGDVSVVFLGNLFGVVDGVLHGTGQMMGVMLGVFNASVLALGAIVITYTLIVSTMNTAQEGQLLGQKWSSIWVPIRSTLGLALLIPKASGYCLMQVFIMWVVVQGVGAADKIWDAALGYLNLGGVIVQAQMKPAVSLSADSSYVAQGAMTILSGQVCMAGIQQILYQQRQNLLNQKSNKTGPCYGTPSASMEPICNYQVPDLIASVNAVAVQSKNVGAMSYTVGMPNLDPSSPYYSLQGICGQIAWYPYTPPGSATETYLSITNAAERSTVRLSRAIAIQQMYTDLAILAQQMVRNDPQINANLTSDSTTDFSPVASDQYGVPYNLYGSACTDTDAKNNQCVSWGSADNAQSAPLLNGTAFQGAVQDYNSVMLPTLTLAQEAEKQSSTKQERKFINKAKQQGWILAGSYFWDLVKLNSSSMGSSDLVDTGSGLEGSSFSLDNFTTSTFGDQNSCIGTYKDLCTWMQGDGSQLSDLKSLFDGSGFLGTPLNPPDPTDPGSPTVQALLNQVVETGALKGQPSATVYGYIANSLKVQLPDQPGFKPPAFNFQMKFSFDSGLFSALRMKKQKFKCGFGFRLLGKRICIGRTFSDIFYSIARMIINVFVDLAIRTVNIVVMAFLYLPLLGMASILQQGVAVIQKPEVNPIVAMANMGTSYINFASELWILLTELAIVTSMIPLVGSWIMALIALAMPLLIGWLTIMLSIGFITAYYIPFVPYMIFTFGAIAWFMAVIEAMIAGPIVALGITHPEGNEILGKGEQGLMILLNVFLRPAMMIIGYIAAIALSYVAVWLLNAGFENAASFMTSSDSPTAKAYTNWASIYGNFFIILVYTTLYMVVVQRSFTLITMLPDKVLRFIGGAPESLGAETAQWGEEVKGKVDKAGEQTGQAAKQMGEKLGGATQKGFSKLPKSFKKDPPPGIEAKPKKEEQ